MKKILTHFVFMCLACISLQAQVFIIERSSNTTLTFDNIKSAVDALKDGDRLYLPSGVHDDYKWTGYEGTLNYSNILVVNKKVFIYGAGYNEGANSTVIKGGTFVIGKDAKGALITGVRFDNNFTLDNVSNCVVSRCKMKGIFSLNGIGANNNVTECEFNNNLSSGPSPYTGNGDGLSSNFSKCVFTYYPSFNTATISNCLFFDWSNFQNCSLSNNIFIISKTVTNSKRTITGSNNTFSYNLWVGGYTESDVSQNNTFKKEMDKESYANVFVDADKGDFHLKDGCVGKNAASDGKDVGIFGTTIPFKENKLPSIPTFSVKVISTETDATGKLPVNIVIDAQER